MQAAEGVSRKRRSEVGLPHAARHIASVAQLVPFLVPLEELGSS
jgi:hypothetical protein